MGGRTQEQHLRLLVSSDGGDGNDVSDTKSFCKKDLRAKTRTQTSLAHFVLGIAVATQVRQQTLRPTFICFLHGSMMPSSKRIAAASAFAVLVTTGVVADNQVISNLSELPYDENNHLSSHIFAYPASDPCKSLIEKDLPQPENYLYGHIPIAVGGDAATALFGDLPDNYDEITDVQNCPAVCLDRGVDASLVGYPLDTKRYNPKDTRHTIESFLASKSCGRVEFGFINYSSKTVSLYWVSDEGEKTYLYPLDRLERNTKFLHTFIGHRFVAQDPDTNEELLNHVVEFTGIIAISNHVNKHQHRDIRKEVQRTMDGEWMKHLNVRRTFSALGFAKGRLPNDIFGSMRSFYYNNRDPPHRVLEEWGSKGLYVNYWETDCNFIQIPWDLKGICAFIWILLCSHHLLLLSLVSCAYTYILLLFYMSRAGTVEGCRTGMGGRSYRTNGYVWG